MNESQVCEVIYHERLGAGINPEHGNQIDGAVVTLTYWPSIDWRVQSHYLLTKSLMINREIIIDETLYYKSFIRKDPEFIRMAIKIADELGSEMERLANA